MSLRDGRNVVVLIVCVLTGGVVQPPSREPCLWSLWNRTNASQLAKKTGEKGWLDEHHSCHPQSLDDHEVEEELLAHPLLSTPSYRSEVLSSSSGRSQKMQRIHIEHNNVHIKMGCFVMWCKTVTQSLKDLSGDPILIL